MKIKINYDLLDAVKDSAEPIGPFKVARDMFKYNTGYKIFFTGYTIYSMFRMPFGKAIGSNLLGAGMGALIVSVCFSLFKYDRYKEVADARLEALSNSLKSIDINTNKELLNESKIDGRNYKIKVNENKIPQLLESKYILVPCYDKDGEVKDVSMLQEHIMGTKSYVLSLGSKSKKQRKLVLSSSNA